MTTSRFGHLVSIAGILAVSVMKLRAADSLPLKEERLGAWHYISPLNCYEGGQPKHYRNVYAPTTVAFGDRVAVFLPGSNLLAEFEQGRFEDLKLPKQFVPVSLSVDQKGNLYCLFDGLSKEGSGSGRRWITAFILGKWSKPVEVPFRNCDQISFDSQNRLWALGRTRIVALWFNGAWDTYTYSDDRHLDFMPVRMAENAQGDVVLFSSDEEGFAGHLSRLAGTLLYRGGKFIRDPKAEVSKWCLAEDQKLAALMDDSAFERSTGYVCRKKALNGLPHIAPTILRTQQYVLVSFGNDGLAWASVGDLASQPPLSEAAEWEAVNDVTVAPTVDPKGDLWVGRKNPPRLVIYSKEKSASVAGEFGGEGDSTMDFDELGRPWIARWHGAFNGKVTIIDSGTPRKYASYKDALKAEAGMFAPGRILPWAVKTPRDEIASGCGFFDEFVVLDARGEHVFRASQINPDEPNIEANAGHGYNPFRDCLPWYDKKGRIYAKVNDIPFCYVDGKWIKAGKDAEKKSVVPAAPEEGGDFAGPFQAQLKAVDGRVFIFHGFHFYEKKGDRLQQIDTGLNPLAYYPFWTGWYSSPGQTVPVVNPDGRLWVSSLGPYADNKEWFILRHAVPGR